MRNILMLFCAVLIVGNLMAQAPSKVGYQTVIRNTSNNLVANQAVGIKISVLQGSASGTAVYEETHNPTTNTNGLASFEIGAGTVVTGTFASIDWSAGPYFIKTETDPTGGTTYTITGTSELVSVPYALHAQTATSLAGGGGTEWTTSGNDIYNSNTANVGIGTTNPSAKLDVAGVLSITGAGVLNLQKTSSANVIAFNETQNLTFQSISSTFSNPQLRMTIDTDGYVGVGTASPSTKLDVAGNITLRESSPIVNFIDASTSSSSKSSILFDHTAGSTTSGVNTGAIEYGPSNGFKIKRGGFTFFYISTSGKMGLGASYEPEDKVSVYNGNLGVRNGNNPGSGSSIGSVRIGLTTFNSGIWSGMSAYRTSSNNSDLRLHTASGGTSYERVRITDGGNVGIGSTNPQEKLTVRDGNIAIQRAAPNNTLIGSFRFGNPNYPNAWAGMEAWQEFGSDQVSLSLMTGYGSTTSRLFIEETGNIGVATTNPSYKFHVNGSAGKPGGGSWTNASDKRLKDRIVPFRDGLTSILAIKPVKYHYNELSGIDTEAEYVGVIAQELQEVAPYMVGSFDKDGTAYLDVDNSAMTYMLVNAVKEQQAQIAELKEEKKLETSKVEDLEKKLEALNAKVEQLLNKK